jgi:predicted  nucleic acid-binding Zn-ribbon protein
LLQDHLIIPTQSDIILNKEKHVNSVLLNLYELQKIDSHIDDLVASRGELPERVAELRAALQEREDILREIEDRITQNDAEMRKITGDSSEIKGKLDKYKGQQFEVKTTREYDAITFQIEDADRRLKEDSDRMGRISIELENAKREADDLRHELDDMRAEFEDSEKLLNEMMAETAAEEKELLAKREDILPKITSNYISIYERVRPAKEGVAVVALKNGVCGGCFNAVPRQLVLELNRGEKHSICEYCGRIIVGEVIGTAIDGEPEPVSHGAEEVEESEES